MICWRCGRVDHAEWYSDGTPGDCTHCGGNPCRWWCLESTLPQPLNMGMPRGDHRLYVNERNRRIRDGEWVFA